MTAPTAIAGRVTHAYSQYEREPQPFVHHSHPNTAEINMGEINARIENVSRIISLTAGAPEGRRYYEG